MNHKKGLLRGLWVPNSQEAESLPSAGRRASASPGSACIVIWDFPKIRGTLFWGSFIIKILLFSVLC